MGEHFHSNVRTHPPTHARLPISSSLRRFRINDIATMVDWDEGGNPDDLDLIQQLGKRKSASSSSSSSSSLLSSKAVERAPSAEMAYSKPSMRGLQQVLAQGWLVQRARDMCSFMHDRYRQAAIHMASQLPDITLMRMCLRVAFKLMQVRTCAVHDVLTLPCRAVACGVSFRFVCPRSDAGLDGQETDKDVYRIAEYCRRCLPLIREHPKREEFVDCLVSAAEASAARGAHEVRHSRSFARCCCCRSRGRG
jgi:hypothetical protein